MSKSPVSAFKLTSADRQLLSKVGPEDLDTFGQFYFDVELFSWQKYWLQYPCKNKLVVAGIRSGKSFAVAFGLLNYAFWNEGVRLLNVSITSDQANIVFNDIVSLASAPRFEHLVKDVRFHPFPKVTLWNGSEIWSRSIGGPSSDATTLRGHEFDIINFDEAAYATNPLAIITLMGRLLGTNRITGKARAGIFTMTSTPKGANSWLYDRWKQGDPAFPQANLQKYLSIRARTFDNPTLDLEILNDIMANYTEDQIRQEIEGLFIMSNGLFTLNNLMAMCGRDMSGDSILDLAFIDPDYIDLENKIIHDWYRGQGDKKTLVIPENVEHYECEPETGHTYVAGWDLGARAVLYGRAEGRNATVGAVYDVSTRPWDMVAYRYDTGGQYTINMEVVKDWHRKYNLGGNAKCLTRIDSLGPGDVIHQMLEEQKYDIDGFKASQITKGAMLQAGALAIERKWTRAPFIRRMVDQFQGYNAADDKNIAQDIVVACCQAIHLAREIEGGVSTHADVVKMTGGSIHGSLSKFRQLARQPDRKRKRWR